MRLLGSGKLFACFLLLPSTLHALELNRSDSDLKNPPVRGAIVLPEGSESLDEIFQQPDSSETPLWEKLASFRISIGSSILWGNQDKQDFSLLGEIAYEHFFWSRFGTTAFVEAKPFLGDFFEPSSWLWDFGTEVQYYPGENIYFGMSLGAGMITFSGNPDYHLFAGPLVGWDYRLNETQSAGVSLDTRFRFLENTFTDINVKAQYRFWF